MGSKEKKLLKIFSSILKIKSNKFNDNLSTKNCKTWDSLNHIKIIIALQEEFKVNISPIDQNKLLSIKIIKKYLEK